MKKTNLTNGVFLDIIQTPENFAAYDVFINDCKDFTKLKKTNSFIKEYKDLIKESSATISKLAVLEELILQSKAINSPLDIKFSTVKDYIYARTPFYRANAKTKDIRIIVDKTTFYEDTNYQNNDTILQMAKEKLIDAMTAELEETIKKYHELTC